MSDDGMSDRTLHEILTRTRRIALVGASNKSHRPSFEVMAFLLAQGFDVTPVNPNLSGASIQGRKLVASLDEARPVEMVDVFRASAKVAPAVADAIRLRAKVVWMQLGVIDFLSAASARDAGILVVMDRCPVIEMRRLGIA